MKAIFNPSSCLYSLSMDNLSKWIILIGSALILIGLFFWLGNKLGLPFGKLPGDVHVQREKFSVYFPIATSIILSVILTILINLIYWFIRRK